MLQHEAERADGWVVGRELMVVEVVPLGGVLAADIDDGDAGIGEISGGGLAPHDGDVVYGGEEGAGEEFVLMRAAGMGEDEGEHGEERGMRDVRRLGEGETGRWSLKRQRRGGFSPNAVKQ